jgi:hypothetical protein
MNPTIDLIKTKSDLISKNHLTQSITENEVLSLLCNELPQLDAEIKNMPAQAGIYNIINCFADLTRHLANIGDLKEVKHCFNLAEKIWLGGNTKIKHVIENAYLYSLSGILDLTSPISNTIKDMLNAPLRKEYNRQVFGNGI